MIRSALIITLSSTLLVCCSGKKETEENKGEEKTTETETKSTAMYIDPVDYDFTKPVEAEKIYSSIMFFYETEFTFLVYPYNDKIIPYCQAYSGPDQNDLSADFALREAMEKQLEKNEPVVIKGRIEGTLYGRLNIVDAVIVSQGTSPELAAFQLNKHDSTKIYNPRELYNVLTKWEAKQVTIAGFYQGFTQSNGSEGKVLERRVDVGPDGGRVIGCSFETDPGVGDKLTAGTDKITVKGTISQVLTYGRPYMTGCEVVK